MFRRLGYLVIRKQSLTSFCYETHIPEIKSYSFLAFTVPLLSKTSPNSSLGQVNKNRHKADKREDVKILNNILGICISPRRALAFFGDQITIIPFAGLNEIQIIMGYCTKSAAEPSDRIVLMTTLKKKNKVL